MSAVIKKYSDPDKWKGEIIQRFKTPEAAWRWIMSVADSREETGYEIKVNYPTIEMFHPDDTMSYVYVMALEQGELITPLHGEL